VTEDNWTWQFLGFNSDVEPCPVQEWFNGLPDEAKDEIIDLFKYLRVKTKSRWQRPTFDPLVGSCGISELRPRDVRMENEEGKVEEVTYRIYGFFGPWKHFYTLLHGTRKDVKNDEHGKEIACRRLEQIKRGSGGATYHFFRFED
jgi:hypothetical protein